MDGLHLTFLQDVTVLKNTDLFELQSILKTKWINLNFTFSFPLSIGMSSTKKWKQYFILQGSCNIF